MHRQPHVEDLDAARQEEQRRVLRLRFVVGPLRVETRFVERSGGNLDPHAVALAVEVAVVADDRQRIARRCAERAFVGLAFDREGEHRTVAAIVFGRDAHLLPPACGGGQQRTVLHRREEAVGTTGRLREADHLVARRELHGIIAHGVAVARGRRRGTRPCGTRSVPLRRPLRSGGRCRRYCRLRPCGPSTRR